MVECDLANSLLFNTFNNLTGLPGTAKYLIIRVAENIDGCECGCFEKSVKSHSRT